jgi:UDP-N-acetylglucosamine acyltransferase
VIHPRAELHPTVQVGAYAVIGERVRVGPGTVIGHHVVLDGDTEIGAHNRIFPGAVIGLDPQDLKYDGALTAVKIGDNNTIREHVTINRATFAGEATVLGSGNLLMSSVHVGHNCTIGDRVVISSGTALAGHVHIESRAVISGVLGIHQFVHVGQLAMIGGMAKIIRDVPPFMLVDGSPAYIRSLNQVGLKRAGLDSDHNSKTLQDLKKAFRLLYRSDLPFSQALDQLDLISDDPYLQHLRQFLRLSQTPGRRGLTPAKRRMREEG